jgi:hypothetical protein
MNRFEQHVCEWCRRSTELTRVKSIDQYLCDECVEIANERTAKAWEEKLADRARISALFDDCFGTRQCLA